MIVTVGFIAVVILFFVVKAVMLKQSTMKMRVVYADGKWFVGKRGLKETGGLFEHESHGTHHFTVVDTGDFPVVLKGQEVAVPIAQVRYFVLNVK